MTEREPAKKKSVQNPAAVRLGRGASCHRFAPTLEELISAKVLSPGECLDRLAV
jgi:hypothetical protein